MKRLKHLIGRAAAVSASAALMLTGLQMPAVSAAEEAKLLMNLVGGGSVIGIGFQLKVPGELSDYTVTLDSQSVTPDSAGIFTSYEYAMNMTKKHTVTVKKGGETVLEKSASVCSYLNELLKDSSYDAYFDVAKAMLHYGASAQYYFGIDTMNPADEGIGDPEVYHSLPLSGFDKKAFAKQFDDIDAPVSYAGMNLSLQEQTKFTLFFKVKNDPAAAQQFLEKCEFHGEAAVVTKNGNESESAKYLEVSTYVNAKDLDKQIKFTSSNGDIAGNAAPTDYMSAAVETGNKQLGGLCQDLYNYCVAAQNAGYATGDVIYKWETLPGYTGRVTTYNYQYEGGNAQLDDYAYDNHLYGAALTDEDYEAYMGAMIEITCSASGITKTIRALVLDSMMIVNNPGRQKGDVDLDPAAFKELTGETEGDFPITWRVVDLKPAKSPYINYAVEKAGQWYIKIQPRNTVYPVKKFEYKDNNGVYHEIPRKQENMYALDDEAMKPFPLNNLTFRLTDIFGETVEDTGVDLGIAAGEEITAFTALEPRTSGVQFSRILDE
ncbi:MAG: hypothetical protein J6Z45_02230 [Oscillospiraceae bacterium]|nr:hypothetical protein [Oscillospiraceae bacterium]